MKVVDLHCDTLFELNLLRKAGETASIAENKLHIDLAKMKKADYLLQCFAVFVHLRKSENVLLSALEEIDVFYQMLAAYPEEIAQVKTFSDILENQAKGKISAMLTMEEGGCCVGSLSALRMFHELGVRMMTVTWNYENELGYANFTGYNSEEVYPYRANTEGGLKELGITFLEEMERLRILVDVSHLSDAGFWDVAKHTKRPFLASHSNARVLSPHVRNLTDDMLREIGNRGGLLGINYYAGFLDHQSTEINCQSTAALMADHIQYVKKVAGLDCIGLGSDFDGIALNLQFKDASYVPLLAEELQHRGFHESEIEQIFYKNAMRFFQEVF